jgi:hypothetical protein
MKALLLAWAVALACAASAHAETLMGSHSPMFNWLPYKVHDVLGQPQSVRLGSSDAFEHYANGVTVAYRIMDGLLLVAWSTTPD